GGPGPRGVPRSCRAFGTGEGRPGPGRPLFGGIATEASAGADPAARWRTRYEASAAEASVGAPAGADSSPKAGAARHPVRARRGALADVAVRCFCRRRAAAIVT